MSARVFKPIVLMEMSHMRRSPSDRRFSCKDIVKVKRALFEPIDHEETQRFLERELAKQSENERDKWEFDFINEVPVVTKGRYEWTIIRDSPDLLKPSKKQQEEPCDISDLYPQPESLENEENEEVEQKVENMVIDGTPQKESSKKQSLITDYMKSRKRPEELASKKLTGDALRPAKMARVSARLHLAS